MAELTPEQAYIFRITHIDNLPWILNNGLMCANAKVLDPNFRVIGNRELIDKRETRVVELPPGGTLSDYVPFYFTHHSPMLYNIKTGYGVPKVPMSDIVILVSSLHKLEDAGIPFLFTDRHAYVRTARYFNAKCDLAGAIDWPLLRRRDFKRDPDDPGKMERYMAEALAYKAVPVAALRGIACHGQKQLDRISEMANSSSVNIPVKSQPAWYF